MITYNHEKYICDAIDGILMQKTNFEIELVIGEDCSTDNTRKICMEYAEKHPDIIALKLAEKNTGMLPNFIKTLQACSGKYIALCEGDDYWTDPYKLHKQVDFLEVHPEYGMVYTDWANFNVSTKKLTKSMTGELYRNCNECFSGNIFESLLKGSCWVWTGTVVFRRNLINNTQYQALVSHNFYAGDFPLWCFLSRISKVKYFNQVTATRNMLPNSATQGEQNTLKKLHMSAVKVDTANFFNKNETIEHTILSQIRKDYANLVYFTYLKDSTLSNKIVLKLANQYELRINGFRRIQLLFLNVFIIRKILYISKSLSRKLVKCIYEDNA